MTPPKTLHLTNAYHATSGGIRTCYRALMAEAETRGRPMCLVVPGEHAAVERCGRFGVIYVVAAPRAPGFDRRYQKPSTRHQVKPTTSQMVRLTAPTIAPVRHHSANVTYPWLNRIGPVVVP